MQVLPEQINQLKNLQTLLLFINQLSKLPDSLCGMTELRCLWVGNNQLRTLPRNFGRLVHLDWGHRYTSSALDGNPLIHPPLEICRMGPQAIDRYMKAISGGDKKGKGKGEEEEEGGGGGGGGGGGERPGDSRRPRRVSRKEDGAVSVAVRESRT